MADNVTLDTMSGGDTVAADDISGVKYQRVKLTLGADGVNDNDVASGNPIPAVLTAGTAAFGKLAANSGVDIGDVDVLTLPSDPLGANADAAVTAGSTGSISGKLRQMSSDIDAVKTAVEGTLGVSGTVTANLSTTDNTVLDNIEAGIDELKTSIVLAAGTNAIGKLAANSGVDIGDVDVLSLPALVRTTDSIAAALQTDAIMNGTTALTPKFAIIDAATSGDNTIVAAVASKKVRVIACLLVAAGTVNVRFESGASGTAKSGQMNLVANTGFVLPFNPSGWLETASNTLLNLELSAAISVDGLLVYVEV